MVLWRLTLEQISLIKHELPSRQRFTYCTNEYDNNASWQYQKRRYSRVECDKHIVLVFETKCDDTSAVLKLMQSSHVEEALGGEQRWFVQYPGMVVVGAYPVFRPLTKHYKLTPQGGVGFTHGKHHRDVRIWQYKDLLESCFLLDRITNNCTLCAMSPAECFSSRLHVEFGAKKSNLDDLYASSASTLEAFLKQTFKGSDSWEYVSPRMCCADPFCARLRPFNTIDFSEVNASKHRNQVRAKNAVRTKQALLRCKRECVFNGHCAAMAHYCQTEGSLRGPFRVDLSGVLRWFVSTGGLKGRTPEDVALIARNAGVETRLPDGRRWFLGKFTKSFEKVTFFQSHTLARYDFSWEDTLRLLRTPYRRAGTYVYPPVQWQFEKMNDEALLAYIELCNMPDMYYGRGRSMWGRTDEPTRDIVWCGANRFDINDGRFRIHSYAALRAHLPAWSRCPPIMQSFLRSTTESAGVGS